MSMSPPPPPPSEGGFVQPGPVPGGPRDHPKGTTTLVLGILGLVCCGVLGPIAWVMGNNALAEVDAAPGVYTNRSTINAGRICGIIATVLLGLGVAFFIFSFLVGVSFT
jgi:hypothetical protein